MELRSTRLCSTPSRRSLASPPKPRSDEPIAISETFDWRTHETDHFEIHHYSALDADLPLVEVAAEQAYRRVSGQLGRDLSFRVPLVLFKTRGEFEQQEIAPEANLEWVTAFSEPVRNRIVLLVDEGGDVYHRITHELVHIFVFQVVPRDDIRTPVPTWIDEGLADYVTGVWAADELLELRRMVTEGTAPNVSTLSRESRPAAGDGSSPIRREVLLGHAAFEFIESRYGREGIRQLPEALRRVVVDGEGDLYRVAFGAAAGEFDAAFRAYLEERFGAAPAFTSNAGSARPRT